MAKYGLYSFELEPGYYTITAEYYQNSTLTYSAEETVTIKDGGNYVIDLLLLPVYSKELMGSSEINEFSENSTSNARSTETEIAISKINSSNGVNSTEQTGFNLSTENSILIALIVILLLAVSYLLYKTHKKTSKKPNDEKIGHEDRYLSRPINIPEFSVKVHNKSFDQELRQDIQVKQKKLCPKQGKKQDQKPINT